MPTYDYRCDRCGADFELWQSISDDKLTVCPRADGPAACVAPGEGAVRKVFSSVGIAFKGDGFYKNDHGAGARSRQQAESKDSSSDKSDSSGSSSSDSSSGASNGSKGSSSDTASPSSSGSSSSSD